MFKKQTEIWSIKTKAFGSNDGWYVKITFSISPDSHYYLEFINKSKEWIEYKKPLFSKEAYDIYLQEEEEYSKLGIKSLDEKYFKDIPGSRMVEWIAPPTPYSNLLSRNLTSKYKLIKQQNTILDWNSTTNIFSYRHAITCTPTTLGALDELHLIMSGVILENYPGEVERYILNCINSLQMFWD